MNAYKGKITFNKELCVLCQTCVFVCPAGAINISCVEPHKSYDFIIWHNTCTVCGNCTYFCPTGAIALSNTLAEATPQNEKYTSITANMVEYGECQKCHEPMINVPQTMLQKGFKNVSEELVSLFNLCPKCRRDHTFAKRVL
ncbi:4Fe-4S binding protein [Sulfurospirillum diekertiae]|uniref:4Fe-4S binding protein n=1 Tax=Sulfurospirillum diekertiae TaxID=1854492 RepID=A0A6G9VVP4_9BACT|nr:4Fe-4S dicluster domain-containing protein [Sulfurospirillum diekertiae]QIR77059.1 4Fe-4S binding protein [Sulfurospirillum diekertiae]QIR79672.1 4Fe-4S binding protein [Sulfurospirillum diekertiae]